MIQPNQRVGEYILQQRIAAGSFGEVWKAHHHVWTDQSVAVKIPTDPSYIRNLQREGVTIHGLVHPNIVRALAFDPFAATPYLAMEFVPGTSLRPIIQQKKLSPPQVVSIMNQILAGLTCAHGQGVIHRDIKPENILVHERVATEGYSAAGAIKLTDFGLGKSGEATPAGSIAYSQSLQSPQAKEIAGTLDYMPPEQRSGDEIDARADLYACGVVLYEMLTGERPAGTDVPSDLNRNVPKFLDEAFRRSYARREKRFTSAAEFAAALQGSASLLPPPLPVAVAVRPSSVRPTIIDGRAACPSCRQGVEPGDQFCMHCGVQLVENVHRCPQCGAYPDATDQYCIFCGQSLTRRPVSVLR